MPSSPSATTSNGEPRVQPSVALRVVAAEGRHNKTRWSFSASY